MNYKEENQSTARYVAVSAAIMSSIVIAAGLILRIVFCSLHLC